MSTEQYGNDVKIQQLEPQPVLSIRATVQVAALNEAQDDMLRALSNYLQQSGAKHAGPPFVRYHTFGDTEYTMPNGRMVVNVSQPSANVLQELHQRTGALVTGRRMFDIPKAGVAPTR